MLLEVLHSRRSNISAGCRPVLCNVLVLLTSVMQCSGGLANEL
jgi:hypothetical protein